MIRGREELKSYEIGDGSTVQVTSRMRGGGRLKDKKIKARKKPSTNPECQEPAQETTSDKSPLSCESAEDAVIRHF